MPAEPDLPLKHAIDFEAHRRHAERLRQQAIDQAIERVLKRLWPWRRERASADLPTPVHHRSSTPMPLLTLITHPAVHDTGLRHAVARELTDHTERLLGKKLPLTAVAWLAPAQDWHIGGEPVATGDVTDAAATHRTFSLDIRITAGTNTDAEKAAWIAAAWETLSRALPGTAELASYVCVTELPATDWGYGGRTQADRKANTLRPHSP